MGVFEEVKSTYYKKGTTEIDPGKVITTVILIVGIIVFGLCNRNQLIQDEADRKLNKRYTIGYTERTYHNIRGSTNVKYHYDVNGVVHKGLEEILNHNEENVITNGGRYFVEFSSVKHSNSKLLLDYPVPDSILSVPEGGWKVMPGMNKTNHDK